MIYIPSMTGKDCAAIGHYRRLVPPITIVRFTFDIANYSYATLYLSDITK